jgi:hypothetical protein
VLNNFEFAKSVHTGRSHTELREVDLEPEITLSRMRTQTSWGRLPFSGK